jgi:hypothetical protein
MISVLKGTIRVEGVLSCIPKDHNPFTDKPYDNGNFFSTSWWGTDLTTKQFLFVKLYRADLNHPFVNQEISLLTDSQAPSQLSLVHPLSEESQDCFIVTFSWPGKVTTFDQLPTNRMPGTSDLAIILRLLSEVLGYLRNERRLSFGERLGQALWQALFVSTDAARPWIAFFDYSLAGIIERDDPLELIEDIERKEIRLFVEQIFPELRDLLRLDDEVLEPGDRDLIAALELFNIINADFVGRLPSMLDLLLLEDTVEFNIGS